MLFRSSTFAVDNIGPNSSPPVALGSAPRGLSIGRDSDTVFLSGFGGSGWAARVDYLPQNPYIFSGVSAGIPLSNASRCSVNTDGTILAVSADSPSRLILMDASTMSVTQTIPMPMFSGNVGSIAWR